MYDFIFAALPWVAIGVSVALVAANFKKEDENKGDHVSIGICLGMCIGTAIGSSLTEAFGDSALTYGICFGMLAGVVAGLLINKKNINK